MYGLKYRSVVFKESLLSFLIHSPHDSVSGAGDGTILSRLPRRLYRFQRKQPARRI
jgi:hypothetical protein